MADFHIHTKMSDGKLSVFDAIDIFACKGIEVINISDHLCDNTSERGKLIHRIGKTITDWEKYSWELKQARSYAWQNYRMLVIQGAEITNYFLGFHIVAVDITEPIDPNLPPQEIIQQIHKQGGLAIAAHPYYLKTAPNRGNVFYLWENREIFKNKIDLWEIGSGSNLYPKVKREHLPCVANSDFHLPHQVFSYKTLLKAKKDIDEIKLALLRQKLSVIKLCRT